MELTRTPRGDNTFVDTLAALVSTSDPELTRLFPIEVIKQPSIAITVKSIVKIEVDEWRDEIFKYITHEEAPND